MLCYLETKSSLFRSTDGVTLDIEEFHPHPAYSENPVAKYDLAVLKVKNIISFYVTFKKR